MIIIAGHATRFKGKIYEFPIVLLIEVLQKEKRDFFYLRHAIDGKHLSQILLYKNGVLERTLLLPSFPFFTLFRYLSEMVLNIVVVSWVKIFNRKISFIGVDPLNALAGILLKKIGIVENNIFYAVDYSLTRFPNKKLNDIYLWADRYSAQHSSAVWNVSSRIYQLRVDQGIDLKKNYFVPNVPISLPKKILAKNKFQFITSGVIDKQLDFVNLFIAIKELLNDYPKIKLKIAGDGPERAELEKLIKKMRLTQQISFLGYLPHAKLLQIVNASGIGVALYNGKWSFNYFGDSMKCREFLGFGLPVITTNTHSTVEDIRESGAGEICEPNSESYIKGLIKIIKSYQKYSQHAIKLSATYKNIHLKRLGDLE